MTLEGDTTFPKEVILRNINYACSSKLARDKSGIIQTILI